MSTEPQCSARCFTASEVADSRRALVVTEALTTAELPKSCQEHLAGEGAGKDLSGRRVECSSTSMQTGQPRPEGRYAPDSLLCQSVRPRDSSFEARWRTVDHGVRVTDKLVSNAWSGAVGSAPVRRLPTRFWRSACGMNYCRCFCARTWRNATHLDRGRQLGAAYAVATDAASEAVERIWLCTASNG